jgi:hypothetical protein
MQSWLAKKLLARNMARLRAGHYRPQLKLVAKTFAFASPARAPGQPSSRARTISGWLKRFVNVGLQIFPDEVVAKGPPWRTRLMVRGTIQLNTHAGETVFENRYVIWGRIAWGLMREYEVYEDTEKSTALDDYLVSTGKLDPATRPPIAGAA